MNPSPMALSKSLLASTVGTRDHCAPCVNGTAFCLPLVAVNHLLHYPTTIVSMCGTELELQNSKYLPP